MKSRSGADSQESLPTGLVSKRIGAACAGSSAETGRDVDGHTHGEVQAGIPRSESSLSLTRTIAPHARRRRPDRPATVSSSKNPPPAASPGAHPASSADLFPHIPPPPAFPHDRIRAWARRPSSHGSCTTSSITATRLPSASTFCPRRCTWRTARFGYSCGTPRGRNGSAPSLCLSTNRLRV